jgi:hypothetical protein
VEAIDNFLFAVGPASEAMISLQEKRRTFAAGHYK